MPTTEDTLRFGIGSADDARSHVWRLWVQRNDVYLGARDLPQTIKVSLHQSGIWRIAYVRELTEEDDGDDRLVFKWKRPAEFARGWTRSVAVVVPEIGAMRPFDPFEVDDSRVGWFASPGRNRKAVFTVLFSRPGLTESDLSGVSMPGDRLVGSVGKADGETVWVSLREEPLAAVEMSTIHREIDDIRINLPPGGSEGDIAGARIFRVAWPDEANAQDQPTIADIPLTKNHVATHLSQR